MWIWSDHRREYGWLVFFVLVLTPALYLAFRYLTLLYGLVWLVMLSIGPLANKHPRARLFQMSLFAALLISILLAMIP